MRRRRRRRRRVLLFHQSLEKGRYIAIWRVGRQQGRNKV